MNKEYITIKKFDKNQYLILNKKENDCFGEIVFDIKWKKWVFEPNHLCKFDSICLQKIVDYMSKLDK